jgi:vacuolar-type H+-ATPase subunit E/Vma4
MRPEEEIETLSRAILKEAQVDAEQLKEEARAKADAIRQRAHEEAEREKKEILDRARQEAERLRSQSAANAQLQARTIQLEHREKLLDKVFQAAAEKLPELQKRHDYPQLAATLLREALMQLRVNKAQVRADKLTRELLEKGTLSDISSELKGEFTLGDPLEEGLGVVVDAADGRLHYDNTLETRLQRLQSSLRASVHKILMGEQL